jgi:glycosyltransferase involved in cell wall biosynthesis
MRPHLSVIICTHNPRKDYLERVLKALQEQTLPSESWELLLIDNASDNLLEKKIDLKWHPYSRHIREEQLGLTPARLRGIKESVSETLVFVDDDNILKENYLSDSLRILKCMPWLGAIGGQILPEYEVPPPDWLLYYERVLAIRRTDRARWSNNSDDWQSQPWGAGMVIRREIGRAHV